MIPVHQTRYAVESLGNCLEACLASILELPLSAVPDRADFVDVDAWAETVRAARERGGDRAVGDLHEPDGIIDWEEHLDAWLEQRGLQVLRIERPRVERLDVTGYWVGTHATNHDTAHAVVYRGGVIVHNPLPGLLGGELLRELQTAHLLLASDPALCARVLGAELLPDVRGAAAA